jgi:hypothetical protein
MHKSIYLAALLFTLSTSVNAEILHSEQDNNLTNTGAQTIKVKSVRSVMGSYELEEHTKSQIRAGYINLSPGWSRYKLLCFGWSCSLRYS